MQSYFTKQITISGATYSVVFYTDISGAVSVIDPVTGKPAPLKIGVYDADGISVLTDPSLVLTSNVGISTMAYGGVNSNLAITLYKQDINANTGAFDNVLVSQNISDSTQAYYQSNTMTDDIVSVGVISNTDIDDGTASPRQFEVSTTYQIVVDFNKLLSIIPANSDNIVSVGFITGDVAVTAITEQFTKDCINSLFKLNNLDYLDDIRNSFIDPNPFNYQFTPVELNSSGQYTNVVDANGNDVVLRFDTTKTIKDLYISQYLSDYVEYFAALDSELATSSTMSKELLDQTKISLLTNASLVNSFVKGTLSGIETIFGFFCKNLGTYTFRIEDSPVNANFIYRITSNLPVVYWKSIIKDLVHPLSWSDEYIEIDNGASQLPTVSSMYIDQDDIEYDMYSNNTRDYYRKYRQMLLGVHNRPKAYLDVDFEHIYNGDTRYYDLAMINDFDSINKFNFKPNEYTVELDYTDENLIAELSAPENFVFSNTMDDTGIQVSLDYLKTGIALQYMFVISYDGDVMQSMTTPFPSFRGQLPLSMAGTEVIVSVTLINDTFSTTVSQTVTLFAV